QVVVDVEITGETGSGEHLLVPTSVGALGADQVLHPAAHHRGVLPTSGQQGEQRPSRLRGGGGAPADPAGVVVGAQVLSPTAIGVLVLLQPVHRPPHRRVVGGDSRAHQGRYHRSGAVHVVRAPAAEPRAVGFLVVQQPLHPVAGGLVVAVPQHGQR